MRCRRRIPAGASAASWLRLLPSAAFLTSQVSSVVASPPPPAAQSLSPNRVGPFHAAETVDLGLELVRLRPRQSSSSCPVSYYSCADQGSAFTDICCPLNQVCALDSDNEPACCPSGAVCTGTAPSSTTTATYTTSYIVDNYYSSFPYIYPAWATGSSTLANREACNAALNQCHENYARCTANLVGGNEASAVAAVSASDATETVAGSDGAAATTTATTTGTDGAATTITSAATTATATGGTGDFGVTIIVSGTTTVVGRRAVETDDLGADALLAARYWTTLDGTSAASICSQLSTQACGGLPTNAAGCASSYTAASTASASATATDGSTSSSGGVAANGQPMLERAVVMAVAAGGILAGTVGMLAL